MCRPICVVSELHVADLSWTGSDGGVWLRTDPQRELASVWKDDRRYGFRGRWRNMELFFMPSAEAARGHLDREIEERFGVFRK